MAKKPFDTTPIIKLFLVMLSVALSATAAFASVGGNELKLKVVDADSSSSLEFAAVSLRDSERGEIKGGYTDADGLFSVTLPSSGWTVEVSMVGYKPVRRPLDIKGNMALTIRLESAESLAEVVVTAREVRNASSASLIDTTAMRHLQPSSFSDLMSLLPGGVTKDPEMGAVNTIALREANGITSTGTDYMTSALGTAFVVDGIRLNTDADMQTTPDANRADRISSGKGVDMRSISTDDVESVEIVRGIPSVEYGELTSGLVNIKRKSGVSRFEARFKADTQSQLFYVG